MRFALIGYAVLLLSLLGTTTSCLSDEPSAFKFTTVDERTVKFDVGELRGGKYFLGSLPPSIDRVQLSGRWKNDLGKDVTIKSVIESCSCLDITVHGDSVEAGKTVGFEGRFEVLQAGYESMGFVIQFDDVHIPPIEYQLELYRPKFPTASPHRLSFGRSAENGEVRQFVVEAVLDPKSGHFSLDGEITTTDKRVECRLLDVHSLKVRRPDTMRLSVRHRATFEAKFRKNAAEASGRISGEIELPLRIGNSVHLVRVPFGGLRKSELQVRPARLVVVVAENSEREILKRELAIVVAEEREGENQEVRVNSSDPRVKVEVVKCNHSDMPKVRCELTINISGRESFDSFVAISHGKKSVKTPVRVRVVTIGPE